MGWNSLTPAQQQFAQRYLNAGQEASGAEAEVPADEARVGTAVPKDDPAARNTRMPALQALEAGLDSLLAEFGPGGA